MLTQVLAWAPRHLRDDPSLKGNDVTVLCEVVVPKSAKHEIGRPKAAERSFLVAGGPQARYLRPRSNRYPPEAEVVMEFKAIDVLVVRHCVRGRKA